jgi:hypothetical protein
MHLFPASDPSPVIQTAVYMVGMLLGYVLLTGREDWQRAWETVRTAWKRRHDD